MKYNGIRKQLQLKRVFFCLNILLLLFFLSTGRAQEEPSKSEYLLGTGEELEMIVHIWGEVKSPGKYRVTYETDIIELISEAGGPTKDANLTKVQLTRKQKTTRLDQNAIELIVSKTGAREIDENYLKEQLQSISKQVSFYNVKKYLADEEMNTAPPVLKPGDVVHVRTSGWYKWREFIRAFHEVALIASVYAWYLRSK